MLYKYNSLKAVITLFNSWVSPYFDFPYELSTGVDKNLILMNINKVQKYRDKN